MHTISLHSIHAMFQKTHYLNDSNDCRITISQDAHASLSSVITPFLNIWLPDYFLLYRILCTKWKRQKKTVMCSLTRVNIWHCMYWQTKMASLWQISDSNTSSFPLAFDLFNIWLRNCDLVHCIPWETPNLQRAVVNWLKLTFFNNFSIDCDMMRWSESINRWSYLS